MSPTDWTSLTQWMTSFRTLHAQARKGKLGETDLGRYQQDREVLAMALLIAQRLSIRGDKTPRQTLRVALSLPVELDGNGRYEETKTLDLGVGGFATMLVKPMSVNHKFAFVLTLSSGTIKGKARVVNVQRKGKPFRVAFAFEEVSPEDSEKISFEVFDAALATIPPP
jgi:hypothetical protein